MTLGKINAEYRAAIFPTANYLQLRVRRPQTIPMNKNKFYILASSHESVGGRWSGQVSKFVI